MDFKDSLKNTKLDFTKLLIIPSGGNGEFNSEFELSPKDFLRFAKEDLHTENKKGIINALSNAKRAIDCQIDIVLDDFGIDYQKPQKAIEPFIKYFDFKDDISYKLKIIQGINLAPGLIIGKCRLLRNRLEHLYETPSLNEVKEAIDIADLFIRSIEGHHKSRLNDFYITDKDNYLKGFEYKLGYDVLFEGKTLSIDQMNCNKKTNDIDISIENPEYLGFIRLMNSIGDDFELTESFKIIATLINHPIPIKHIKVDEL